MMKSFFKKLAFVMALAMVVTMATPAGKEALAASFYIAKQTDKVEVTEFKLEVGKEQDFRYIGAADYKDHTWNWESSDKTVATVDKNGLVKGLKDGVATITVKGGTKYVASMVVTVGNGGSTVVAGPDYTVKQDTVATVKVLFGGKNTYKETDLELFYVLDGGWSISWPIKEVKAIDGGFSVEPYVEFEDGGKYIIKVGAKDEGTEFVTTYGTLTHLEIHYECNNVKDSIAVVDPAGEDDYEVVFNVKFFAGEVDVTSLYESAQGDVEYTMYSNDEEDIDFDESGTLVFSKAGQAAVITAKYSYDDDETGEEIVVDSLKSVPVVAQALPAYNLTLKDWAIVNTDVTVLYDDIDWTKKNIRANDDAEGTYIIVAKFTDSYGKTLISDDRFVTEKMIADDGFYGPTTEDTPFTNGQYYFTYTSANNDKMLVGLNDAKLTTYTNAKVAVILGLNSENEDIAKKEDSDFVKNVGAFTVEVTAERKVTNVTLSENGLKVVNAVKNNENVFLNKKVKLYIKDQYNENWKLETIEDTFKVEPDVTGAGDGFEFGTYDPEKGYVEVTLKGNEIYSACDVANKSKVVYSITVGSDTIGKKTVKLEVTPKDVLKGATEVKVKEARDLSVGDIELATNDSDNTPRTNTISVTMKSSTGSYEVGYDDTVVLYTGEDTEKVKNLTTLVEEKGLTAGSLVLAVYGPDSKLVADATADTSAKGIFKNTNGTYGLRAGVVKADGVTMDYLATGKYTVELREVKYSAKNGWYTSKDKSTSFNVTNNSDALVFVKLNDVTTEKSDIKEIIDELVVVTVGGVTWDFETDNVVEVYGRYNEDSGHIIITSIKFNVTLDAAGDNDDEVGYEATVAVNQAIAVEDFDGAFDAKTGKWSE